MTDTRELTPTEKMYHRGFGTGHPMDLRPTQVSTLKDQQIHNILRQATEIGAVVGALEPVPITLCGLRLENEGVPYNDGVTTCSRCAILAAYEVISVSRK